MQICKKCGSTEVARCKWVNPNTSIIYNADSGTTLEWCMSCKEETVIADIDEGDKCIDSFGKLKYLSKSNGVDCHIRLNGGLKSSKHIWYDEESGEYEVINHIDDTTQRLSYEEMFTQSIIGEAMAKKALFID